MDSRRVTSQRLFFLLSFSTIVRCIIALTINLGNDEAYYFTYALQPDWNHFDHPPMVGLLIHFSTLNLHWLNTFSMRLGPIVCANIATLLIFQITRMIGRERAALTSAVLYNACIYTSIIAGTFILPDSPEVVFWLASLYCGLRIIRYAGSGATNHDLLWMGFWIGLATMSKVHGIFLWAGFLIYVVLYDRRWLRSSNLYTAMLITLFIILSIYIWNDQNNFITWRFHSQRVAVRYFGINAQSFFTFLFGEIFYMNPFVFILCVWMLWAVARKKYLLSDAEKYLLWCGLPLLVVAHGISLFRDSLPHWAGPAFISLLILSAIWITQSNVRKKLRLRLVRLSVGFVLLVIFSGILIINLFPGTYSKSLPPDTGHNDVTLDMFGWNELLPAFKKIRDREIASQQMHSNDPLVVNKWFPGGHECFYLTAPLNMRIVGVGKLEDLHKFVWLNSQQGRILPGGNAYFVSPSNYFANPKEIYKNDFSDIILTDSIVQQRNGRLARVWYIYQLRHAKKIVGNDLRNVE